MVEGSLDIFWENNFTVADPRRYHVSFLPYSASFGHGAVVRKHFVGEDALFVYLISIQAPSMTAERRQDRAREWMLELHSKTSLSLPNVILTEQQASEFSRAAAASS